VISPLYFHLNVSLSLSSRFFVSSLTCICKAVRHTDTLYMPSEGDECNITLCYYRKIIKNNKEPRNGWMTGKRRNKMNTKKIEQINYKKNVNNEIDRHGIYLYTYINSIYIFTLNSCT